MSQTLEYLPNEVNAFLDKKSKKTLVIVGNAPLDRDFSEIIDSCDCVIRFNNCKNYIINSGKKTDILILNNTGNLSSQNTLNLMLKNRTKEEIKNELPYMKNVKHVWFIRPDMIFLNGFIKNMFPKDNAFRDKELASFKIIGTRDLITEMIKAQKISKNKVRVITKHLYMRVWDKLILYGTADAIVPSTGVLGIEMILDDPNFHDYEKYIVGFSWKGWNGHPWQAEKLLVNKYIKNGTLTVLSHKDNIIDDKFIDIGSIFKKVTSTIIKAKRKGITILRCSNCVE